MKRHLRDHHHLRIRVLGDGIELAKSTLATMPGVQEIKLESAGDGDWDIFVEFSGDKVAISVLLKQLIAANVPVLAFTEEADSLEDVFMKLTKGIVS